MAMPFIEDLQSVYEDVIIPITKSRELYCARVDDFFSHATQSWDVDKHKLSQMFYNCLEDLHGDEAKKLRKEWGKVLNRVIKWR